MDKVGHWRGEDVEIEFWATTARDGFIRSIIAASVKIFGCAVSFHSLPKELQDEIMHKATDVEFE